MSRALIRLSPEVTTVLHALATVDFAKERAALGRAEAIVATAPLELRGLLPALAATRSVLEALASAAGSLPSLQDVAEVMAVVGTVPRDAIDRAVEAFEGRRH